MIAYGCSFLYNKSFVLGFLRYVIFMVAGETGQRELEREEEIQGRRDRQIYVERERGKERNGEIGKERDWMYNREGMRTQRENENTERE